MTTTPPLLEELASIKNYIRAARDILKDGFMPDIQSLEQRIANVCLGIQGADMHEQSRCLPELASLLKNLDACEQEMRHWHEAQKKVGTP